MIVAFQTAVLLWVVDKVQRTFRRMGRLSNELVRKSDALEERTLEAETASRAKSIFLANISHEIRTPINAIPGFRICCNAPRLSRARMDQVAKITPAGVSLLRLINDPLDFSKIEAALELIARGNLIPARPSKASCRWFRNRPCQGPALEVRVDRNIPAALIGDDMRFNQVILNLLSNADRLRPKGGSC